MSHRLTPAARGTNNWVRTHAGVMARAATALLLLVGAATGAEASVIIVPDSALTPSPQLYTDIIGSVAVMTGGAATPGIGDPTGRNDDGFSGPINLGFSLDFFGQTYTAFFANNNGNISFGTSPPLRPTARRETPNPSSRRFSPMWTLPIQTATSCTCGRTSRMRSS